MSRCPNHPDDVPCPVKMGQDAHDVILDCRTDKEAAAVAVEAMRMMLQASGGRPRAKSFAGAIEAAAATKALR